MGDPFEHSAIRLLYHAKPASDKEESIKLEQLFGGSFVNK